MAYLQKDPAARPDRAEVVFEMAAACVTRDTWERVIARRGWETHLPAAPTAPVPARLMITLAVS